MFRYAVLLLIICSVAACGPKKHIASKHPNGKPEVVIYIQGKDQDALKVREKVYYENGNMDYIGRFQDGVEHGEWIYYYEDGSKKFVEHWNKGEEQGIFYDYSPSGQILRELHYEQGELVKTLIEPDIP